MQLYEIILDIIEKKGPVSFSSLCDEMNEMTVLRKERKHPVLISHIKSAVSNKKDLFVVNNGIVSIRESMEFVSLTANIGGFPGPSYTVKVDFIGNTFCFFELYMDCRISPCKSRTVHIGDVEQFKKGVIRLGIWNWDKDYQQESLVLDGTSWFVKLKTKGAIYESGGLQCFPKNWSKFCKSVSRLVGIDFK